MVSLAGIQSGLARMRDSIYLSPAPQSETLSRATGSALYLKLVDLQAMLARIVETWPREVAALIASQGANCPGDP